MPKDATRFAHDHPEFRAALVLFLRKKGHIIHDAKTAVEAYQKLMDVCKKHLVDIKAQLEKHEKEFKKDSANWGFPGDLGKIEADLQDALIF